MRQFHLLPLEDFLNIDLQIVPPIYNATPFWLRQVLTIYATSLP